MKKHVLLLVAVLLLASVLSSGAARDLDVDIRRVPSGPVGPPAPAPPKRKVPASSFPGAGGFEMPSGGGDGIPGWGGGNGFPGGGWGAGYGVPSGGYSGGGFVMPSVVCSEKGPCYKKKLTCPAKCFTSFSHSGKNYGAGGGGGGCSFDCGNRCVADC